MTVINNISSKKSKCINNIDFNPIKIVAAFIIKTQYYILNVSFTEVNFQDKIKIAVVLSIYKKIDKIDSVKSNLKK